jgi:hypothetical protein
MRANRIRSRLRDPAAGVMKQVPFFSPNKFKSYQTKSKNNIQRNTIINIPSTPYCPW